MPVMACGQDVIRSGMSASKFLTSAIEAHLCQGSPKQGHIHCRESNQRQQRRSGRDISLTTTQCVVCPGSPLRRVLCVQAHLHKPVASRGPCASKCAGARPIIVMLMQHHNCMISLSPHDSERCAGAAPALPLSEGRRLRPHPVPSGPAGPADSRGAVFFPLGAVGLPALPC
jgi:hypothetical protein